MKNSIIHIFLTKKNNHSKNNNKLFFNKNKTRQGPLLPRPGAIPHNLSEAAAPRRNLQRNAPFP